MLHSSLFHASHHMEAVQATPEAIEDERRAVTVRPGPSKFLFR